jgi:WD40 repeat protein/serine/threonine protein kinase
VTGSHAQGGDLESRARKLFADALERDPSARERYIAERCGPDRVLADRVIALLRAFLDADSVIPTVLNVEHEREHDGAMIGPYRLLEIIGEGGFGIVWLAERREPMVQRVALKVIKPGMDSKGVIARFEQERQALAVMDHPNVAKVFDGGITPSGRPYFVMEYVKGEPITQFCDRQRMTLRQRLELFVPVCEAVQHAHLKGIIHRDISPSNILVSERDGQPQPKIIDFGVAKAITHTLTDRTIFTGTGQIIGKPEYMSPEQAEMGATDIDTRTDVYSLGVVLYELLSGLLPFDPKALRSAGYDAIRKVLREQDPPKPSTRLSTTDAASGEDIGRRRQAQREALATELRSELEWIPLKALRKDRTLRYQSPSDMARDVRNYLSGKPLDAGPESATYRIRKFVHRHRGVVAATSAVILALVLGLAGTLWQAGEATREAAAARAAEAEQGRLAESESKARIRADAKAAEADHARKAAELEAYVANLAAADASAVANEPARVRAGLDACPEALRGWEWRWLNARSDSSLAVLRGHEGAVTSAALSPDGTRIVTASSDHTARVWDASSAAEVAVLRGHEGGVVSAAFSPDGTRIVTASWDNTARVWDAASGKELAVLRGHERGVESVAFSPDGTRILTASVDKTARVWDAASGKELAVLRGHEGAVTSAAFSPDGARIVTASFDITARIWDAASGKELAALRGHGSWVNFAAFSPDGARIVTASRDRTARVWDGASGKDPPVLRGHEGGVLSAAFSPDGLRVLTASEDKTARVWDVASGKELAVLRGHEGAVTSAAFGPDGARIVTASHDRTARVWNASSGEELAVLRGHESWVISAAFSPDGARIVTASFDMTARVWDAASGKNPPVLRGHEGGVASAAFSPDGTRIVTASADRTARVWDATDGKELAVLNGHLARPRSAAFSPDSTRIVTASDDKTARVWDAASGKELAVLRGHDGEVMSAAFSPDGARIVTASYDSTSRVWDAASGKELAVLRGHESFVYSAAFSPDGARIVTASHDRTARVWNAASGKELAVLRGHESLVNSAAFSPNGARIVTASSDHTARVWDASSAEEAAVLRGHEDGVVSAAFSPDSLRILTASEDKTAGVWDAASGRELAVLRGHEGGVASAAFSPDGSRIITASLDGTARVWDSVPYRQRFPAIERTRRAADKMAPWVRSRLDAGETPEAVRAEALADRSLSAEERTAACARVQAMLSAQARRVEADRAEAAKLNVSAWYLVRFPPEGAQDAARAVEDARKAMELAPGDALILNTLGIALFRAGEYQEALKTLTVSAAGNTAGADGPHPADWAFIAMAHWKLGHEADARAALVKFQQLCEGKRWKENEEVLEWRQELGDMIPASP